MTLRLLLISVPVALGLVLSPPLGADDTRVLATHNQDPPPIVLVSKAGRQRAVQETFCVSAAPHAGETRGVTRCVDMEDALPRRLSVVRPRERVAIVVRGATAAEGIVGVHRLGKKRDVLRFRLRGPRTEWRVRLRPGAYEVEVEVGEFETADGRTGDTSGSLGVLVDRKRRVAIIPVSALTPSLTG